MRRMLFNIIMLLPMLSSGQHEVYLMDTRYTVTDTFTVNAHKFYFMKYDGRFYLRIKPFYGTNRFVGIVGDGTDGKKYRAELVLRYPDGWEILEIPVRDSVTVRNTFKLTVFSERGPCILALSLPMQKKLQQQLTNLYK